MSDLSTNQLAKLAELKKERDAQKAEQTPAEQVIDSGAIPEVSKPEEPKAEAVPAEVTKVDEKKAEESTTNPTETQSEEIEFKWDAELEQTPAPQASGVDLKKIGSALNLEVNDEDTFVKTVSEKLSKLKTLEEQTSKTFEGVPDALKETIEIAKKGGDWMSFIETSLVDANKLDPVQVYEQEYERQNLHRFKNADGSYDYEALDAEMDGIAAGVKIMGGKNIINQIASQQQQRKQFVIAEAQKSQDRFNKELSEAAKELPSYFPKEEWGVNVESKHASSVIDGIANGKLVKKHLGDIDSATLSKLDAKKLSKLIFLAEAGKNIVEHSRKQGIVQGKRELLDKTQNPQVTGSGIPAAPDIPDDKKPLTAAEKLKKAIGANSGSL